MKSTQPNPLSKLSDKELIHRLETLTQKERQTTLEILLHLIEVDRRSLYLPRGYASLFDYCTRRLRYSESAAMRRIKSARCIREFPEVYELLAKGRLNLATVSLIAGVLTKENKSRLLAEAVDKSKREIEMIVALYNPKKVIRDRVRPVYVAKPVPKEKRELLSGKEFTATGGGKKPCNVENSTPSRKQTGTDSKPGDVELEKKFKLEFTVDPRFMEKLNKVRSILSTKYPGGFEFGKLFEIVIDEFIERHSPPKKIQRREQRQAKRKSQKMKSNSNSKSRLIPAAVRDKVFMRDGGRCTFVSAGGIRCNSHWNLQIDHIVPYARGGNNTVANFRLLCGKHNRLEAERSYGKEFMARYCQRE
jgi:5-methylcytosine-specific restriction endonuclease McrA